MLIGTAGCRVAQKTLSHLRPASALLASEAAFNHPCALVHSTEQLATLASQASRRVAPKFGAAAHGLSAGISAYAGRACDISRPWDLVITAAAGFATNGSTGGAAGKARKRDRWSKGRNVKLINMDITSCASIQQLQQLVQQDGAHMDYINLAAAVVTLQKLLNNLSTQQQQQVPQQSASLLDQLWQLQQSRLPQCGVRELANMTYSVCLLPTPLQQQYQWVVAQHLLPAFLRQVSTANPQDISNVLYGLAASGQQLSQQSTQMLVDQLVSVLPDASTQTIANTLWAIATMQQQVQPKQLQQLLDAFCASAAKAKPQGIANTLWAVATMQQQVQPTQLQQLLDAFCAVAHKAKPQEIKDTLWAVATMQQQIQPVQLQHILAAFCAVAQKAKPQEIANSLWAVARMQQQVESGQFVTQLEQLLCAFVKQLSEAVPQNVSNTLWACAEFRYLPEQLVTAPGLFVKLATATPQHIANTAWACGQLGYKDEQLMSALLSHVLDLVGSSDKHLISSGVVAQNLANLCWSLAVLDMREHAPAVLTLVQAGKPLWASMAPEDLAQLYQVHMWLTDHGLAGGQGLAGVLTTQELHQCQSTWHEQLGRQANMDVTTFQQSVYDAFQRIPMKWLVPPAMEQVSLGADEQPDGAALIDITARTVDGVWLAIEADGPWHFRRPDRGLMGPTLYRNRALAVRGYVLISVSLYEWDMQRSGKRKQQYLLDKVTAALQQAGVDRPHLQLEGLLNRKGPRRRHRPSNSNSSQSRSVGSKLSQSDNGNPSNAAGDNFDQSRASGRASSVGSLGNISSQGGHVVRIRLHKK